MTLLHITNIKDQAISPLSLSPSKRLRMKRPTPCFGVKWPQMNLYGNTCLKSRSIFVDSRYWKVCQRSCVIWQEKWVNIVLLILTSLSARFMCLMLLKHVVVCETMDVKLANCLAYEFHSKKMTNLPMLRS